MCFSPGLDGGCSPGGDWRWEVREDQADSVPGFGLQLDGDAQSHGTQRSEGSWGSGEFISLFVKK